MKGKIGTKASLPPVNKAALKRARLEETALKDAGIAAEAPVLELSTESPLPAQLSPTAVPLPEYISDSVFRRVEPYWFEYGTWAKGRWQGRSLLEVFTREFRDRPRAYYEAATAAGLIKVNGRDVNTGYLIRNGDRVEHRIHRHEPPVLNAPIPIIYCNEQSGFIVVEKPASVPMHPAGRYRHNSLVSILKREQDRPFLSCVNRLDRLVSGVCILATDAQSADRLRRQMQDRSVRKFYLAVLAGKLAPESTAWTRLVGDRVVAVEAPLLIVEHKLGLSTVADRSIFPEAKPSLTHFVCLSYDAESDTTLVLAEPITGRTHQIRLHAQYLRHPIHNDPLYCNGLWKGLLTAGDAEHPACKKDWVDRVKDLAVRLSPDLFPDSELTATDPSTCPDCENPPPDPDPERMQIHLHAYKYSSPEMGEFQAGKLPEWVRGLDDASILETAEEALSKAFQAVDFREQT